LFSCFSLKKEGRGNRFAIITDVKETLPSQNCKLCLTRTRSDERRKATIEINEEEGYNILVCSKDFETIYNLSQRYCSVLSPFLDDISTFDNDDKAVILCCVNDFSDGSFSGRHYE